MPSLISHNTHLNKPFHDMMAWLRFKADNEESNPHAILLLDNNLTEEEWPQLAECLQQKPLAFGRLSLTVQPGMLENPVFLNTLGAINASGLRGITLQVEDNDSLTSVLANPQLFRLPVLLKRGDTVLTDAACIDFTRQIQANQHPAAGPSQPPAPPASTRSGRPIAAKVLLSNRNSQVPGLQVVMQHVEVMQETIQQNMQVQQEVQQQQLIQSVAEITTQQAVYHGELLGREAFYLSLQTVAGSEALLPVLDQEFFGNVPLGIKYFSEDAAKMMRQNLFSFCALNPDNLPACFILKQTEAGEGVLDYDPMAAAASKNIFTPILAAFDQAEPLLVAEAWPVEALNALALAAECDETLYTFLQAHHANLLSIWARFGDQGVNHLIQLLKTVGEYSPELSAAIGNYITHFPHWDGFVETPEFTNHLTRITAFPAEKKSWLCGLLRDTGSSRHDLTQTLAAFEFFWQRLCALHEQAGLAMPKSAPAFKTPAGGNPVVYMERLLTILTNARDLEEQLACFTRQRLQVVYTNNTPDQDGIMDSLELTFYGAYYASLEGFRVVDPSQALYCDHSIQDRLPFNRDSSLYRLTFDSILTPPLPNPEGYGVLKLSFDPLACPFEQVEPFLQDRRTLLFYKGRMVYADKAHRMLQPIVETDGIAAGCRLAKIEKSRWDCFEPISKGYISNDVFKVLDKLNGLVLYKDDLFFVDYCAENGQKITQTEENNEDYNTLKNAILAGESMASPALLEVITRLTGWKNQSLFASVQETVAAKPETYWQTSYKTIKKISWISHKAARAIDKTVRQTTQTHLSRLIGLQAESISLDTWARLVLRYHPGTDQSIYFKLFALLAAHSRGAGLSFNEARDVMNVISSHLSWHLEDVLYPLYTQLCTLFHQDIRLSPAEGKQLAFNLGGMNSSEFEHTRAAGNKEATVEALIEALIENKFAVFRYLEWMVEQNRRKSPMLTALKTTRYLAQSPSVAAVFRNDLLIFSEKITQGKALYWHSSKMEETQAFLDPVRAILEEATQNIATPNNLSYVCQEVMKASIDRDRFLAVIGKIRDLPHFDPDAVQQLLRKNGIYLSWCVHLAVAKIDNEAIKIVLIDMLNALQESIAPQPASSSVATAPSSLAGLSIAALQEKLTALWGEKRDYLNREGKHLALFWLSQLQQVSLAALFDPADSVLNADQLGKLAEFKAPESLEELNEQIERGKSLGSLNASLIRHSNVKQDVSNEIANMNLALFDYETFYALLDALLNMPQRPLVVLLKTFLQQHTSLDQKAESLDRLRRMRYLHTRGLSSEWIAKFMVFKPDNDRYASCLEQLLAHYVTHPNDPLMSAWAIDIKLTLENLELLLIALNAVEDEPDLMPGFFLALHPHGAHFVTPLVGHAEAPQILEILARCFAARPGEQVDYGQLRGLLKALDSSNLNLLLHYQRGNPAGPAGLRQVLASLNTVGTPLNDLLAAFEKAPFGERNFTAQFDDRNAEATVNAARDGLHNQPYPWLVRVKWLEAFQFVNRIGNDLRVYQGKSASELSNQDIQTLFAQTRQALKNGSPNPAMARMLALGLVREAMYRATGMFANSTQLLAVLSGLFHQGHTLANINTGEGKSLTDPMMAAMLWLESDRVDLTTGSLVDAERDLQRFRPFFNLLGIKIAREPISANTALDTFERDGVNWSTFGQLALFYARCEAAGLEADPLTARLSLIANECDLPLLDDPTLSRFASVEAHAAQPWIYSAINAFVTSDDFKQSSPDNPAEEDARSLRQFLRTNARQFGGDAAVVKQLSNEQLITWIDSALRVHYKLVENSDYVVVPVQEKNDEATHCVRPLMRDGKVNWLASYGNGGQQLLHAHFNRHCQGQKTFAIEPEAHTVSVRSNINLLRYYLNRQGKVYGSTGTVGSPAERRDLHERFGFEFDIMPPHHQSRLYRKAPEIFTTPEERLHRIFTISLDHCEGRHQRPMVIFCRDIATVFQMEALLKKRFSQERLQRFTGIEHEPLVVEKAGDPGMITITTNALSRNADIICKNEQAGLIVVHTTPDSTRLMGQKDGRGGRQGQQGIVFYLYVESELNGQTPEAITDFLDNQGRAARQYNDQLYDVIGYLYSTVTAIENEGFCDGSRKSFLLNHWGRFIEGLEQTWHENQAADFSGFVASSVQGFQQLLTQHVHPAFVPNLNAEDLVAQLEHRFEQAPAPALTQREVVKADCMPVELMAQQVLDNGAQPDRNTLKNNVLALRRGDWHSEQRLQQYVRWLLQNRVSQTLVCEVHAEVLREELRALHRQSAETSLLSKWFGGTSPLTARLSDWTYLLFFRGVSSVPGVSTNLCDDFKQSVNVLLDEYLARSWFVNSRRKEQVAALREQLANATTFDEAVTAIMDSKISALQSDRQHSGVFKESNPEGESRFQTTLNLAIKMMPANNDHWRRLSMKLHRELNGAAEESQQPPDVILNDLQGHAPRTGTDRIIARDLLWAVNQQVKTAPTPKGHWDEEPPAEVHVNP